MAGADGALYVGGYFSGSASFGGSTLGSPGFGGFVTKLSPEGNVIWATPIPSTDFAEVRGIVVDSKGNVHLAGAFAGTATFGETTLTAAVEDAFVASLDSAGAFRWALTTGTDMYALALGLGADQQGDLYVAGALAGTGMLGDSPITAIDEDAFVAKLDPEGNVHWITTVGGASSTQAHAIAVRPDGETVVAGAFYGFPGATIQAGDFTLTSQGSNDAIVLMLDPAGKITNAKSFGGPNRDEAWAVAADPRGGAFVAGQFLYSSTFGSTVLESAGYGLFLAALDEAGDLRWVTQGGGPTDATVVSLAVDGAGDAYLTGLFSGETTFGETVLNGAGLWDLYLARIGSAGAFEWAAQAGGTGNDYGRAVAFAPSGELLVTGFFEETAAFGADTLQGNGDFDVLVWKGALGAPVARAHEP